MKKIEGLKKTAQPLLVLTMRKTLVILFYLVAFPVLGHAQQQSAFQPEWSVEGQAGGSYTLGEGSFGRMLSPAFSVNVGYRFSEPVGIRLGIGGFSGKGYVAEQAAYHNYNYIRTQADVIIHSFGTVKNLYTLAGIGLLVGTSNGAVASQRSWKAPQAFAAGRFGVGYRFPVGHNMAVTAEAVYHLLPDALNSVHNGTPGGDVQALVGFHYTFGRKKAAAPREVAPAPAALKRDYAAEARAAIEARAAARQEVPVEEPVEEPVETREEKPVEVPVEASAPITDEATSIAIAKAVAEAAGISDVRVYFDSNSWTVKSQYEPELMKVADFLNENPGYLVKLTAYCDKRYGTPEYNQEVSKRRANAVARFLKRNGVPDSRILTSPVGGTDSFGPNSVKRNRFVVCEIVKEL